MPRTIREQLEEVERDITLYNEFAEAEKARFKLECSFGPRKNASNGRRRSVRLPSTSG